MASIFGLLALFLLGHFVVRNLRYGASMQAIAKRIVPAAPAAPPIDGFNLLQDQLKHNTGGQVYFDLLKAHSRNWYLVVFQAIIAFLLISTTTGRDVVNYLVDSFGDRWYWSLLKSALIIFSVYLYSAAIWIVPWHLMDYEHQARLRADLVNLSFLRILGLMTYAILGVSVVAADRAVGPDAKSTVYWYILSGIYLLPFTLNWLSTKLASFPPWHNIFWALLGALTLWGCFEIQNEKFYKCALLVGNFGVALGFWYLTKPTRAGGASIPYVWFDRWDQASNERLRKILPAREPVLTSPNLELDHGTNRLKRNRLYHRFLTVSSVVWAVICTWVPNLMPIPPLVIVFSGVGFFLLAIDSLGYSGARILKQEHAPDTGEAGGKYLRWLRSNERYAFLVLMAIFLFVLVLSVETSKPVMEPVKVAGPLPEKIDMNRFLDLWAEARRADIEAAQDNTRYPVFIFAGQGGGSRAGYWTSAAMTRMDELLPGMDVKSHTLAVSTVSGSSVGALTALAWWNQDASARPPATDYCRRVFRRNFVSSGLAGNFYGDFLRKLCCFLPENWVKNRNTRLQEEEAFSVDRALKNDTADYTVFKNLVEKGQFGGRPFTQVYQPNGQWRTDLPLFFANSTHVQTGRRTLVNPVIQLTDSTRFANVIDLCQRVKTTHKNKELSIGQATNLSELFPYVSAAAYIPGLGGYVDAGYYENFGLSTARELYQIAQHWKGNHRDSSLVSKLDFHIICIINGPSEAEIKGQTISMLDLDKDMPSQFTAPASAATSALFGGHAETARQEVRNLLSKNRYHEILLKDLSLPLTRLLTEKNVEDMNKALNEELKPVLGTFGGN